MEFSNEELRLIRTAVSLFKDKVKNESYRDSGKTKELMDKRIVCDEILNKLGNI